MLIEARDPRLFDLVPDDAVLEPLLTGFRFTEGPIWHPLERHLTFSDIPGDAMYRWSEDKGCQVFRQPSHMANGSAFDGDYRIITCEHATSRVSRSLADGSGFEVLASHYLERELNSPNDVIVSSNGSIYFTDPPFGRINPRVGVLRDQELTFQGVFRLDPNAGVLTVVADDFERPNGLCFSNDERRLFINDSAHNHIRVFDVLQDGSLAGGQVWARLEGEGPGNADGMKVDGQDNLYCTGRGGIHIFDPDAAYLGRVLIPEQTANLCFGDADLRRLYIAASSTIYRLQVLVAGFRCSGS